MTLIASLENVSKGFRGETVLRDVCLEVQDNECIAITGPNGSGKSVLFRLLSRLLLPDHGRVVIDHAYLSKPGGFPSGFGVLIDRPGYIGSRSGLDNLLALARIRKVVSTEQVVTAMRAVGLDPGLRQTVNRYSLGMKQKLGLAQAFMENQQVLLLDEPFNALDEESRDAVHLLLKKFLDQGRTILFTSHDSNDVMRLSTRHL
ncbi:MAG: ABC transporter ATP-binding protein, partial [Propionibacteriaceae bacterium]|nr:ABC transporter ATP-binding protein [Propionibacteriaceae bacterium]